MALLNRKALGFIAEYERQFDQSRALASRAEDLIDSIVQDLDITVHLVSARAKKPYSLRAKLRRKRYKDPWADVRDCIGVRVITYYRSDVDLVVRRLKHEFDTDADNSVDKRTMLDLRSFGYRSVHLVARLKAPRSLMPENKSFAGLWFEIQVRSLLEHAWAEIEHEVVYKAGVTYPGAVNRHFAALAGTLEILDGEFEMLRGERNRLIDEYRSRYAKGRDGRRRMDVARLIGFFESEFPQSPGWRDAGAHAHLLPAGLEATCVEALGAVKLGSADTLRLHFRTRLFRSAVGDFAAANAIEVGQVSHLALIVIAVATKNAEVLRSSFTEMLRDPSIAGLA